MELSQKNSEKLLKNDIDNYNKTLDEILSCMDHSSGFLFCSISCGQIANTNFTEGDFIDAFVLAYRLIIPT